MADFPTLKTGAVAQYPFAREVRFLTQAVRFLDGSQQHYALQTTGLRRWTIKLSLLDEQELASIISFAEQQGPDAFTFTDPLTGDVVTKCIISEHQFHAAMSGEMNGQAQLVIEEIP